MMSLAHKYRMGSQEAQSFQPLYGMHGAEQAGKVAGFVEVVPVGVHRLPQQRHLLHAPLGHQSHLMDDVLDGAADLPSAAEGDDAEGAHQVAAVDDGHVAADGRTVRCHGAEASLRVDAQPFLQQVEHGGELLRAHENVHLGKAPLQFLRLCADHASHQGENLARLLGLDGLHHAQRADDLVLGALAHDAGVEHHHVGLGGVERRTQPGLVEGRGEGFRVGLVHLTADCPDVVAAHGGFDFRLLLDEFLAVRRVEKPGGGSGIRTHEADFSAKALSRRPH